MNTHLPQDVQILISKEKGEEYVQTPREKPLSTCIAFIVFGIIWSLIVYGFFELMPTYIAILLYSIGAIFSGLGIYDIFAPGSYFIITKDKLIKYRTGKTKERAWNAFTGKIDIKGKNVIIELKTGTITHSRTTNKEIFTNDQVFISGIPNAQDIFTKIKSKIG